MAYTAPPDKNTGDIFSETNWDTHIRANILYFKARMDALDYVQITTAKNLTAATEGTADTVISGTSIAYDNVRKKIEFFSPGVDNESASRTVTIVLFSGDTVLGRAVVQDSGTHAGATKIEFYDPSPTAGTYAYVIKAYSDNAGDGVIRAGPGGSGLDLPAFLRVSYDA